MKKGQASGASIATFVFLIAIFIVVYVLLIPQEDRDDLLNKNNTIDDGDDNGDLSGEVLLRERPGLVRDIDSDTVKHKINSVNLFLREEPITIDIANSVNVEKGLFSESNRELRFNLEDMNNLNDVTLFFTVTSSEGNLILSLNGVEIFDGGVGGLEDINLPLNLLRENNILQLRSSSPGWNIFQKNQHRLSNLKIRQNFELTQKTEERTIILSPAETGDAKLDYTLFCNRLERSARLRIFVNGEEASNEVVNCVSARKIVEIDEEDLEDGKNTFLFEIDKGDFLLNDIELEVDSEEGGNVLYKFVLTEDQFEEVQDEDAELKLEFSVGEEKEATLNLNGNEFNFLLGDDEDEFSRFVGDFLREGNNFIEIMPDREFSIEEMEIKII